MLILRLCYPAVREISCKLRIWASPFSRLCHNPLGWGVAGPCRDRQWRRRGRVAGKCLKWFSEQWGVCCRRRGTNFFDQKSSAVAILNQFNIQHFESKVLDVLKIYPLLSLMMWYSGSLKVLSQYISFAQHYLSLMQLFNLFFSFIFWLLGGW